MFMVVLKDAQRAHQLVVDRIAAMTAYGANVVKKGGKEMIVEVRTPSLEVVAALEAACAVHTPLYWENKPSHTDRGYFKLYSYHYKSLAAGIYWEFFPCGQTRLVSTIRGGLYAAWRDECQRLKWDENAASARVLMRAYRDYKEGQTADEAIALATEKVMMEDAKDE